MERRHLQEIPASARNVQQLKWSWDSKNSSDLLCGMGVSPMEKDPQDTENTPQDLIVKATPPQKKRRLKERDDGFFIARRPRIARASNPGISWDTLPDELLLGIFSYLHLTDLVRVSRVCKRWNRLSCDESLWYSLDLCGKHLADGVVGKLLSLGVVVFRCPRSCIGEPMFTGVRPLRLQHVDLSNCTVSKDALLSIVSRCYRLQNLSLEGMELSDDIMRSIAQNTDLIRLNIGGCSGFSPDSLVEMLKNCSGLCELNLSWCDFTADHVKCAVSRFPSSITELNFSGYRQNLELSDVETLVTRCPELTSLDLSDSVMLTADCFAVLRQLLHLQHLGLSRCYQICPATLLEMGKAMPLKTLSVFGIVTDSSLQLLKESLPHIKINCSFFSTVARPTTGPNKKNKDIWGLKCKLTLNSIDS
ncbi:S-phase kinase-associated protein 2 isoform X2 [Spea bombifrons]|uniref:S-phase kinase-associated protein 2 isoform X2 n=1 Tax=Spea bombifrons TaxID=233779 RepID=UPI00234A2EFA|nr:S-phase kinase-associated protein 2 isoform X2 [Spea bombifrons]